MYDTTQENDTPLKHCKGKNGCNLLKPLEDFGPDKKHKDGKKTNCRECSTRYSREWANKDPEYHSKSYQKRVENDPEYNKKHYSQKKKRNPNYNKDYYQKNMTKDPNFDRRLQFRRRYGITIEDYDRMFFEQKGLCKICKQPETSVDKRTGKVKALAVDHDHKTGEIRGLLCWEHNTSLGKFKHDPDMLISSLFHLGLSVEEIVNKVREGR